MESNIKWVLRDKCTQQSFILTKPSTLLGRRTNADIVCINPCISRLHASFIIDDKGLSVQDLGGINGVYVNDVLIEGKSCKALQEGDEVGMGISFKRRSELLQSPPYIYEVGRTDENGQLKEYEVNIETISIASSEDLEMLDLKPLHQAPGTGAADFGPVPDQNALSELPDSNSNVEKYLAEQSVCRRDVIEVVEVLGDSYCDLVESKKETIEEPDQFNGYTVEDNFIVISDDDDENLVSHSQLLNQTPSKNQANRIEDESNDAEDDNIFCNIKKEIEEMDRLDCVPNAVPVEFDTECELDWSFSDIKLEPLELPNERVTIEPNDFRCKLSENDVGIVYHHDGSDNLAQHSVSSGASSEANSGASTDEAELQIHDPLDDSNKRRRKRTHKHKVKKDESSRRNAEKKTDKKLSDKVSHQSRNHHSGHDKRQSSGDKNANSKRHHSSDSMRKKKKEKHKKHPHKKDDHAKKDVKNDLGKKLNDKENHKKHDKDSNKSKEKDSRKKLDDNAGTKEKKISVSKEKWNYVKPPIIAPHTEVKKRDRPEKEDKNVPRKKVKISQAAKLKSISDRFKNSTSPQKRKSSDEKTSKHSSKFQKSNESASTSSNYKTCPATTTSSNYNHASATNGSNNNDNDYNSTATCSKHLPDSKSEGEKSKTEESGTNEGTLKISTRGDRAKVKVSENRGLFLLATEIPKPARRKSVSSTSVALLANSTNTNSGHQDPLYYAHASAETSVSPTPFLSSSILRHRAPIPSTSTAPIPERIQPAAPKPNLPMQPRPQIDLNIDDILTAILTWSPNWFSQQRSKTSAPPINQEPLVQMCTTFDSYNHYYRVVKPLLMLELWASIYKDWEAGNQSRQSLHTGRVVVEEKGPHSHELRCISNVSRQQYNEFAMRNGDLVVLELMIHEGNETLMWMLLGSVNQVEKLPVRRLELPTIQGESAWQIKFNIRTKAYKGSASIGKAFTFQHISALVSAMRVFRSLKYLERSKLCPSILKPEIEKFVIPEVIPALCHDCGDLNTSQFRAVSEAVHVILRNEPGMYLIQGPPGTGKSTVIINIIRQIFLNPESQFRILLLAYSNAAVDQLALKLNELEQKIPSSKLELKFVRVGPDSSISDDAKQFSLSRVVKMNLIRELRKRPHYNDEYEALTCKRDVALQKLRKARDAGAGTDYRKAANEFNRIVGEMDNFAESKLEGNYKAQYTSTEDSVLAGANIICSTLTSSVNGSMERLFRGSWKQWVCIIDEATQHSEQQTLLPLVSGVEKMILVGDPQQLPGTTLSKEAKKFGYGNSLFSRISSIFAGEPANPIKMLNVQYRMHPAICSYPNRVFYRGSLMNDASVMQDRLVPNLKPYFVFNYEQTLVLSQEYRNTSEVEHVLKILQAVVEIIGSRYCRVGIITLYNKQKEKILEYVKNLKAAFSNIDLTVNTVDGFQGQEKDVIIFSCVRLNNNMFVNDKQRLNVALTRAKSGLYIVGTRNLFTDSELLSDLRADAENRNLFRVITSETSLVTLVDILTCHTYNR